MANKPRYETKFVPKAYGGEEVANGVLIECNAMAGLGYRLVATEGLHSAGGTDGLLLVFELRD